MNDVVAVALVSAGSSLIGASVGALTTYKISLRNAETTIAAANAHAEVELSKVAAENQRLQLSTQEKERRNRQATYHQFLDVSILIFQELGAESSFSEFVKTMNDYNHLLSGVLLFAPPSVRDTAYEVNRVYLSVGTALTAEEAEHPEKTEIEQWRDATAPLADDFGAAVQNLVQSMHADVTRGIADDRD